MHYFVGLIVVLVGAGMVMKTEWIIQNFGTNAWAEAKLGFNGGSRLFYKCIGIILIFVGFLIVTNLFGSFFMATVGRFLVPQAPQQ